MRITSTVGVWALPKLACWSRGRVVLVGDAAYCLSAMTRKVPFLGLLVHMSWLGGLGGTVVDLLRRISWKGMIP